MQRWLPSLAIFITSGVAAAQPTTEAPAAPAEVADPSVAITISPIHVILPMVELTAEVRLAPKLGVAVVGGAGSVRVDMTNDRVDVFEAGASLRYYLTGSFRGGVQLGAELDYLYANTNDMTVNINARGLAVSPFLGYKWTHRSGFTFDGQIGAAYLARHAQSDTNTASDSQFGLLLNLNIGWSF